MKWLLVITLYMAPDNAVDWDGPWEVGASQVVEQYFNSEAECRNEGIALIGRLHQGMMVPMRHACLPMQGTLPKGVQR